MLFQCYFVSFKSSCTLWLFNVCVRLFLTLTNNSSYLLHFCHFFITFVFSHCRFAKPASLCGIARHQKELTIRRLQFFGLLITAQFQQSHTVLIWVCMNDICKGHNVLIWVCRNDICTGHKVLVWVCRNDICTGHNVLILVCRNDICTEPQGPYLGVQE